MQTSESIKEISGAFLNAQVEIEAAVKGSKNPFFHSNYADLNSVMSACKEQLNKNGIAVLQPVVGDVVETVLIHAKSGEWFRSETKIINAKPNDPQAQGSAITYARRYGLQSMVFIGAEDDDGEGATTHTEPKTLTMPCPIHKSPMAERYSQKTGKTFFAHMVDGKPCYGKAI